MGRFILIYSHVLILLVHVQMLLALFLNECPDKLMWTLRAKQLCGVEDKYMCLYDTNERSFRELCKDAPEFHRPGNIFIVSGNLQFFAGRQCNGNRYQPHKWWTNGSSDCQYLKSSCNGEGQVPYDNGTITKNRKCRCDYTNYYTFVNSTRNKCHCDPIEEDCSCYRRRCNEDQVLTPDYDCVGVHEWTGRFVCPEYKHPKITDDKKLPQPTICPDKKKDSSGTIQQSSTRIAVSLLSGALVILSLIVIIRNAHVAAKEDIEDVKTKLNEVWTDRTQLKENHLDLTEKIRKLETEWKEVVPLNIRAKPSAPVGPLTISNITDSSAFIEWQAPQNDGGAKVEEYHIEYQLVDETTWKMCETVNGINYEYCVNNLKEGQSYNFKVTASNSYGPGSSLESIKPTKLPEIPKKISMAERNTYMKALGSGTEVKKYVRIQVIGQDRVGKTSLVRRLLKCKHDGKSTDGIEIHRGYQMRTSGEGELFDRKVETQRENIALRIKEILNRKNDPSIPSKTVNIQTSQNRSLYEDNSIQENTTEKKPEEQINRRDTSDVNVVSNMNNDEQVVKRYTNDFPDENKLAGTEDLTEEQNENANEMTDSSEDQNVLNSKNFGDIAKALNGIFKTDITDMETENFVDCGIWDFAGQKDYYATHQTFFTPHAIYLLVVDITKDINPTQNDGTFKLDYSGDYIDFWFDSIHCFCQDTKADKLCPPVIMVCTNVDKLTDNLTAAEVFEKKKKYKDKFRDIFGGRGWYNHNRGIHIISNTHPVQSDIDSLKLQISDIAKEMKFFAETLPTRWIKLENAIEVLKESTDTVSLKNIEELAYMNSIETKKELILFLNHQHKIGSIIFFEDIPEYIILRPYWLVKCFRCLVCDEDKRTDDITMSKEKYNPIHKGELSGKLIDQLFKKEPSLQFRKKKNHILGVLEKFDIIVIPKCENVENTIYYMPCMLENSSSIEEIIKNNIKLKNPHRSPWLILEFEFLPIVYFNHILFNYIRQYTVCKVKSGDIAGQEHPALFVGKAIVQLDKTANRLLIICFSMNAISLQIWSWEDVLETTYKAVLLDLCNKIGDLEKKFMHNLSYKIKAKCSTGDYSRHSDRISHGAQSTKCEEGKYCCEEHCCDHNTDDIEMTWLKHVPYVPREKCYISCQGLGRLERKQSPSNRHLRRLAASLEVKDCRELLIRLGLDAKVLNDVQDKFASAAFHENDFKYTAMLRWKESATNSSFKTIQDALHETDRHLLCEVIRDVNVDAVLKKFSITEDQANKTPTKTTLQELSNHIGNSGIQLGVELGLQSPEIEGIQNDHSCKLLQQNKEILRVWSQTKFPKPTIKELIKALQRIGKKDCLREISF